MRAFPLSISRKSLNCVKYTSLFAYPFYMFDIDTRRDWPGRMLHVASRCHSQRYLFRLQFTAFFLATVSVGLPRNFRSTTKYSQTATIFHFPQKFAKHFVFCAQRTRTLASFYGVGSLNAENARDRLELSHTPTIQSFPRMKVGSVKCSWLFIYFTSKWA